jgi:MoaA/NifB/PqqE/SkfB family radical SAM enzyme
VIKFYDPTIDRKSKIVDSGLSHESHSAPMPSYVEISPSGTCNRVCSFCPRSNPDFPDVKEFITFELLEKVSGQLSEVGYTGTVLFSGFVEPMLDKQIFEKIAVVRKNLPDSRIDMVTNGDVLNKDRLRRLFEFGLTTLLISAYDGPDEADALRELCRSSGLTDDQWIVRDRWLPPEQDFGITLTNRAGMMDDAEHQIAKPDGPLKQPCFYPHYTFFMDYQGDVLLCPHDWGKKLVVGNMTRQNFIDIWMGRAFMAARRRLGTADRGFSPCDVCDANGTLMGKKHVEAWARYENDIKENDG